LGTSSYAEIRRRKQGKNESENENEDRYEGEGKSVTHLIAPRKKEAAKGLRNIIGNRRMATSQILMITIILGIRVVPYKEQGPYRPSVYVISWK